MNSSGFKIQAKLILIMVQDNSLNMKINEQYMTLQLRNEVQRSGQTLYVNPHDLDLYILYILCAEQSQSVEGNFNSNERHPKPQAIND